MVSRARDIDLNLYIPPILLFMFGPDYHVHPKELRAEFFKQGKKSVRRYTHSGILGC